jgi:hypothetical protein
MNKIKKLPLDDEGRFAREFKANGRKYTIRSATEGISIERFNQYEMLSLALGFGANFQALLTNLNNAIAMANACALGKETFVNLVLQLDAMKKGVVNSTQERNNIALMLCTLFIVREDEDLTTWNEEEANDKVKDWNKAGYDVNDFLLLALSSVQGFSAAFNAISKGAKENPLATQLGASLEGTK